MLPSIEEDAAGKWAMGFAVVCFLAVFASPTSVFAQSPGDQDAPGGPRAVGTMLELMEKIVYPTSNAVFYAGSRTPETEEEWNELEADALMLAESANLMMMSERAPDEDQWMRDAALLLDAGEDAFQAARDRDVEGLRALNDPLYQSCVACHDHYDVQ